MPKPIQLTGSPVQPTMPHAAPAPATGSPVRFQSAQVVKKNAGAPVSIQARSANSLTGTRPSAPPVYRPQPVHLAPAQRPSFGPAGIQPARVFPKSPSPM